MFHNPKAPYSTSNTFTNFTPSFYTRPYILSHVVPTFFCKCPPPLRLPFTAVYKLNLDVTFIYICNNR